MCDCFLFIFYHLVDLCWRIGSMCQQIKDLCSTFSILFNFIDYTTIKTHYLTQWSRVQLSHFKQHCGETQRLLSVAKHNLVCQQQSTVLELRFSLDEWSVYEKCLVWWLRMICVTVFEKPFSCGVHLHVDHQQTT